MPPHAAAAGARRQSRAAAAAAARVLPAIDEAIVRAAFHAADGARDPTDSGTYKIGRVLSSLSGRDPDPMEVSEVMKRVDADRNGTVDFEEFKSWVFGLGPQVLSRYVLNEVSRRGLAQRCAEEAGMDYAIVWKWDADRGCIKSDPGASFGGNAPAFVEDSLPVTFGLGNGMIGRVAQSGEAEMVTDVQALPVDQYVRMVQAKAHGIRGSCAIGVDQSCVIEMGSMVPLGRDQGGIYPTTKVFPAIDQAIIRAAFNTRDELRDPNDLGVYKMWRVLSAVDPEGVGGEEVRAMLERVDTDGDGRIDFNEFKGWMLGLGPRALGRYVVSEVGKQGLAQRCAEEAGMDYAIVWRWDEARQRLAADRGASFGGAVPGFVDDSLSTTFAVGTGMVGRVAQSGTPEMVSNVQDLPARMYVRLVEAKAHGIKGSCAIGVDRNCVIEMGSTSALGKFQGGILQ